MINNITKVKVHYFMATPKCWTPRVQIPDNVKVLDRNRTNPQHSLNHNQPIVDAKPILKPKPPVQVDEVSLYGGISGRDQILRSLVEKCPKPSIQQDVKCCDSQTTYSLQ